MQRARRTRRQSTIDDRIVGDLEIHCEVAEFGAPVFNGADARCVAHSNRAKQLSQPQPRRHVAAAQHSLVAFNLLPLQPASWNCARKAVAHVLLRPLSFCPAQVRSRSGQHSTATSPAAGKAGEPAPPSPSGRPGALAAALGPALARTLPLFTLLAPRSGVAARGCLQEACGCHARVCWPVRCGDRGGGSFRRPSACRGEGGDLYPPSFDVCRNWGFKPLDGANGQGEAPL